MLLFLLAISCQIYCQNTSSVVEEQIKMFILTSIYSDNPSASFSTWDRWIFISRNHFDYLEIEYTDDYMFLLPNKIDSIGESYSLQLFKVKDENSRNKSRYLLKYKDFYCQAWLRVGGYMYNDTKLFFDYLKERGVKKKNLKKLIEEWEEKNRLFKEIDLPCLLDGYNRNSTKSNCFIAISYIKLLDTSIGFEPLSKDELNSIFSRVPLYGDLRYCSKKFKQVGIKPAQLR